MGLLQQPVYPILFLLFAAAPIRETSSATILWAAPAILISAMMIAWAAESSQYFIAQGFALAILAWLQTLPEFAVEAVFAWHQDMAYWFETADPRTAGERNSPPRFVMVRSGDCNGRFARLGSGERGT